MGRASPAGLTVRNTEAVGSLTTTFVTTAETPAVGTSAMPVTL